MTTFSADRQPSKGRGQSRSLTKGEVQRAWDSLRSAAAKGDLQASALLIALAECRPILQSPSSLTA